MAFLSTLSLRRATYGRINDISRLIFLSTLSLRRATFDRDQQNGDRSDFYPRSPCGERRKNAAIGKPTDYFYPRSPCGERPLQFPNIRPLIVFLSTLSLRRATKPQVSAESDGGISIHALLAESDDPLQWDITRQYPFLSTLSLRRATKAGVHPTHKGGISIHALLAESDL